LPLLLHLQLAAKPTIAEARHAAAAARQERERQRQEMRDRFAQEITAAQAGQPTQLG